MGVELVPLLLQLRAQFGKIVDFPVIDDPYCLIFVVDGLMPAGHVNDAEAPHSQAHRPMRVDAIIIWPTMNDGVAHAPDFGGLNPLVASSHQSGYSAHCLTSMIMSRSSRPSTSFSWLGQSCLAR